MSDSETSSPNSDKKRNVGNETPFVGLRAHGNGIKPALMSTSSCSKGMVLPLVLDNLKDRNAVLGFLFDVAVQRNYYDNMGLESVVTEEDYLDIYEKDSIVRRAAQMAQCGAGGPAPQNNHRKDGRLRLLRHLQSSISFQRPPLCRWVD